MMRIGKQGTVSQSTRLFALALLLSGCLAGSAQAADPWGVDKDVEVKTSGQTLKAAESVKNLTVVENGELTVSESGALTVYGNVTQTGGTLSIAGGYSGFTVADGPDHTFEVSGGTLNVGASSGNPALVQFEITNLKGGKITVSANAVSATEEKGWRLGSVIYGNNLNVSDTAEVTLGNYGAIGSYGGKSSYGIAISGGAVSLEGDAQKSSLIRASASSTVARGEDPGAFIASNLSISGGTVTVKSGKSGVILSRETNFSGGEIVVDGKLTVAGSATGSDGVTDVLTEIGKAKKWGDFNFAGGKMTMGSAGVVDFITGDMRLNSTNGGTITSGDSKAVLNITSTAGSAVGNVYSTNLTVTGGTLTVDNLKVDVASLDANGKDATPGVRVSGGSLVVAGETTFGSTIAEGVLSITGNGAMTTNTANMITITPDSSGESATVAATANATKALKGSTGTVTLKNTGDTAYNLTTAQFNALKSDLGLANDATLHLLGFVVGDAVDVEAGNDGKVTQEIPNADAEVAIDTSNVGDSVDELEFTKDVAAKEITISGDNASNITGITTDKSVTLTGSGAGNNLVSNGTSTPIDLTAGDDVSLGVAGGNSSQGGVLGDIVVDNSKSNATDIVVAANDGQYTVGGISVKGTNVNADVEVQVAGTTNNTSLTATEVDLSNVASNKITKVTVDNGSLVLTDGGDITLNSGKDATGVSGIVVTGANSSIATTGDIVNAPAIQIEKGGDVSVGNVTGVTVISVTDGDMSASGDVSMTNTAGVANTVVVENSDMEVGGKLTMVDNTEATVSGGSLIAGAVSLGGNNSSLTVGSDTAPGVFVVDTLDLAGGDLTFDPPWKNPNGPNSIANATQGATGDFATPGISSGNVRIYQNSYWLYGSTDRDWMNARIAEAGSWGPAVANNPNAITSAIGIYKPLTIGTGFALVTDGDVVSDGAGGYLKNGSAYTQLTNTAYFGSNTLLVVNGDNAAMQNGAAAITGASTATLSVMEDAKLYIADAKIGTTYQITSGFNGQNSGDGIIGDTAWNGLNSYTDSAMIGIDVWADKDGDGSNVFADTYANNARDVYDRVSDGAADTLDWVFGSAEGSTPIYDPEDEGGIGFISRAANNRYNPNGYAPADIEGAAQMAALGGAPLNAFNIMRLTSNSVAQRFSFSSGMIGGASDTAFDCQPSGNRVAIWGGGIYEHGRVRGMDVGPFENSYRSNLGGGNVGIDFTFGDNVRVGVMGSFGGGRNKSRGGDFAYTENDFDYQAVRGYAGWSMCNFSLLLDGGFTNVKNKIDQRSFDGPLHATAKVHAWDVGLTAEYKVSTGFIDVIPHAGIRYEGVNTRGHDVRYTGGADIMRVDSDTQHVLTIPVGVSLAKNINFCNGWNLSPYVDAGARFSVGDRSYKTNTRLAGVAMPGFGYKSKIVDAVAFDGSAGLNVDNGRFFGGVNYNITHSKNQTTHGFWANVGMSF